MNPSTNSGGSSIPGARPGMIASGPSGNVPGPITSGPSPEMPVSMPSAPRGRSGSGGPKKGIIIGGILIVVGLVLGVVAVILMPKGGGGGGNNREVSFNELINYVTSGEDVDTEIDSEYSATNNYYFLDGWDTEEEKAKIYAGTKYLMDGFINTYKNGENERLNNLVKNTKDLFDFLYVVELKDEVINSSIFDEDETSESNYNNLKNRLMGYYDFSNLEDNMYVDGFLGAYNDWVNSIAIRDGENADFGLYRYVDKYYNMERNFVANVYTINAMLSGNYVVQEEEGENVEE